VLLEMNGGNLLSRNTTLKFSCDFKFRVCKSVHHHTFKWINQTDASISQIYCIWLTDLFESVVMFEKQANLFGSSCYSGASISVLHYFNGTVRLTEGKNGKEVFLTLDNKW